LSSKSEAAPQACSDGFDGLFPETIKPTKWIAFGKKQEHQVRSRKKTEYDARKYSLYNQDEVRVGSIRSDVDFGNPTASADITAIYRLINIATVSTGSYLMQMLFQSFGHDEGTFPPMENLTRNGVTGSSRRRMNFPSVLLTPSPAGHSSSTSANQN